MRFYFTRFRSWCALLCLFTVFTNIGFAQQNTEITAKNEIVREIQENETEAETSVKPLVASILPKFYDKQNGISLNELIFKALDNNLEIAAYRLEIDKAKARLRQAGLRPNPTLEFEQTSGRLVGNGGDGQFSVGASLPIEIYGRRNARISAARYAVEASEAEIRNRERILTADILINYSEALAALREIDQLEQVLELDLQTTKFVQIRVNEGETPPLELNLLQAEVERLRSRRQLAEGKLASTLTRLKGLAGLELDSILQLREEINTANLPALPQTTEAAVEVALRTRPDVLLTRIEEQVATAGLRLVRAQSKPDLTAYTRYTQGRQVINVPEGSFPQRDRSLTVGVAIGIPIFNKNQGAKTEAEISVKQAQTRREFAERVVRSEIISAFQRYQAANSAVLTLQNAAIPRSAENVRTFRKVYEIGEIKITDLIAEQRRMLDANRDLTEALTEKYRAQADLTIALGAGGLLPAPQ